MSTMWRQGVDLRRDAPTREGQLAAIHRETQSRPEADLPERVLLTANGHPERPWTEVPPLSADLVFN
jgi:hypothetical protein